MKANKTKARIRRSELIVRQFEHSGLPIMMVDSSGYTSPYVCANIIRSYLKRTGMNSVECICSRRKVYIFDKAFIEVIKT